MAASRPASDLDLYELAWLAGGPARVVDTALVALVRSGRIRAHSPGELATVELTRRHPVEAAVLDAVGPSGHRSVDTIRWRVATDDRLLDVGRRLQRDGLVIRFRLGAAFRSGPVPSAPTRAGRQALEQCRPRARTGPDELKVALGGRVALLDPALRASIFDAPGSSADPAHGLDFADGAMVAGRTRATIVADANRLGAWMGQ